MLRAFGHAFAGIAFATRTQRNMRIHWVAAALVLSATVVLHLARPYVVAIVLTVAGVLAFEMLNTAIEAVVDLLVQSDHPLAKAAKDTAAGAVLVVACAAVVVGCLSFAPGVGGADPCPPAGVPASRPR